jgi:hypothetical protein
MGRCSIGNAQDRPPVHYIALSHCDHTIALSHSVGTAVVWYVQGDRILVGQPPQLARRQTDLQSGSSIRLASGKHAE